MSSDLLAEFDSFYRATQNGNNRDTSASSEIMPISALEGLSSFRTSNPIQSKPVSPESQWEIPLSKPSDDIWGSFEANNATIPQVLNTTSFPQPLGTFQSSDHSDGNRRQAIESNKSGHNGRYTAESSNYKPHIIRRPTIDLFSSNIDVLAATTSTGQYSEAMSSHVSNRTEFSYAPTEKLNNANSSVLFDAADELNRENDDDEFGDFETVGSNHLPEADLLQVESPVETDKVVKRPSENLLMEKNFKTSPFPYPQAPKSPSFKERNPFANLAVETPSISETKKEDRSNAESPVTAWPEYEQKFPASSPYHDSLANREPEEEDWGDFEDLPSQTKDTKPTKFGVEVDNWTWDTVEIRTAPAGIPPSELPPPTNIPPPSVLLPIFLQLFNLPQSSLFQVVANQPFALKNRILSDPSTIDFLKAYILLATVAARIIAGRKLRWKRDMHLSQAMKIGPASVHGKGGMKLAGVDKAEIAREERETAEVIRVWRDQVGRLRSAIAAANSSLNDQVTHLAVPEITETMVVRTEGVLTAPKACVLCGLKREERIPKVDFHVEDSFGEWWVDHWGHRDCRNFWQEHENELKQR